jgi:putative FmdB family regulatory protein
MPTYNYFCEKCDAYFEIEHSMTSVVEECVTCESPSFIRVPSIPIYMQNNKPASEKKVGDVVKEYIEKNKKSVREEKRRLKNKSHE